MRTPYRWYEVEAVSATTDAQFIPNPTASGKKGYVKRGVFWKNTPAPRITLAEPLRPERRRIRLADWLKENWRA